VYIEGVYLDGKTSKRKNARLEVLNDEDQLLCLLVYGLAETGSKTIKFDFDSTKVESRLGNTPREISFDQGQLFITEDNDGVDQLVNHFGKSRSSSLIHKLETNLFLIILAIIVTVVFSWGVVEYGIPKSAKYIAFQLPKYSTESFGDSLSVLDKTLFDASELDMSRQQEIRELVEPYLKSHSSLNPKLAFRSGMKANALALPDGVIVLTDDFVNLVENDKELLAVFFHELGHLRHKHIARRALQGSMITALVIFIVGDIDTIDLVTGLPTLILDLSYSREFEREADKYALDQLHQHNISVDHFSSIMGRLETYYYEGEHVGEIKKTEREKLINDFLSTHPSTDERIKLISQFKEAHSATH